MTIRSSTLCSTWIAAIGFPDPRWRGILHDRAGRLMVAIRFNNDTGDSLEWADAPEYPERDSALDVRMPANQAVYAVTH